MNEKEILNTIKKFVEGDLDIMSFEKICKENADFRNYVKDYKNYFLKQNNYNLLDFLDKTSWKNADIQLEIQIIFHNFLTKNNIDHCYSDYYYNNSQKNVIELPSWLCDNAITYAEENIVEKAPENLNKTQRKKWIKEQIKKTFPYQKRPPSWVQGTEGWPQDKNGKFLTFMRQFDDGEMTVYLFINEDTNEIVTIQEYF